MSRRLAALAVAVATAFVAVTAFRLAYHGSRGAAIDAGIPPGDASWYPWCVEGAQIAMAVATVILRGRDRVVAWVLLAVFVGVSTGANMLYAHDHGRPGWWPLLVAAIPPLSLPAGTWVTERIILVVLGSPGAGAGPAPVLSPAEGQDRPRTGEDRGDRAEDGQVPDGPDPLLSAGRAVLADLNRDGAVLTRSALIEGLRARDVRVGTGRATELLRQLRAAPVDPVMNGSARSPDAL
jgi:hypothetical protein